MDKNTKPSIGALLGRQPPYSVENEQALLGALILDNEKLGDVSSVLNAQDFYFEKHEKIYSALIELSLQNRGVDVVTLLSLLVQKGVYTEEQGASYIRQLAENVPSLSNIMDYATIIHEKALLRALIHAAEEIMEEAYDQHGEPNKIIDSAQQKIFNLTQGVAKHDFSKLDEIIQQFYIELKEISSGNENTKTIKTYFGDIDRVLVGMNPGDLVLIGARPGMGKTSFVMNIAAEVAKRRKDKSVAIFSMEMSKTQLASRLLSSEGKIESRKLRDGQLEEEDLAKLAEAAVALSQTNIYIDESGNLSPMEMRTKLRRIPNLGLVVVDYLQLMNSDDKKKRDNRVLEVGDITRNLKIMAKDLGCPIMLCSQLSRIAQDRKDKRPQLTDLRESGAIEQDADVVLFLHREFYYNHDPAIENEAECIVSKNRHGSTEDIKMGWNGKYTLFFPLEHRYDQMAPPPEA
ncbi:MAG: replicative DNA helicase [Clostridia bacterium]|nr:replicative DNA helicase [Clostridia bacterium]